MMKKTSASPDSIMTIFGIALAILVFGALLLNLNETDYSSTKHTELVATSKDALIVKAHDFKNNHEEQDVFIGEYHKSKDGIWRVNVTRHERSFSGLSNGLFELSCIAVLAIMIVGIILL